ncbi:DegT/DnrJ/EryC1/StrS family aminotransferase [Streptomyces silvisoli]|uniref:DegT/DnrJ/EryC1/StrS family aminotransferase n=1 Tax=Streptomyces silvisoli TaxID=3034235 RepID=A0ABT5ZKE0_9ACTN|nr:DegT/DnrJ/EryC1/StrS family aminotransferase [Streptomyces silvisoli]MDF3290297.1 DegT/DnrJ/EryC1/StrS family aminotransferase [Streptomyces silvisoli]
MGGDPVLAAPPEYRWPIVTEQDIKLVTEMLGRAEIAYVGQEGQVRDLEERFCDYLGVSHALAVNSGTNALHSAYFGIELRPGDEVLAPTYTFMSTVTPLFAVNAVPVLIDADEWTGNLDPSLLEAHITPRTRAIVVTHMNGFPVDMAAVVRVARKHDLKLVEDCSLAHGAVSNGQQVGTFGDAAAFSLQSNKHVTAGTGGILVTNDARVHERAVLLGHFLDRSRSDVRSVEYLPFVPTGFGFNNRIHPVGAALAVASLGRLDEVIAQRCRNAEQLDALLAGIDGVQPPVREAHVDRPSPYGYQPLYHPEELDGLPIELFVRAAAAEGVPVARAKTPPLHRMPAFQRRDTGLGTYGHFGFQGVEYRVYRDGELPRSEAYVSRVLRFPAYPQDEYSAQELFVAALKKVGRNAGALVRWARREGLA